jgi:hypothetical protein
VPGGFTWDTTGNFALRIKNFGDGPARDVQIATRMSCLPIDENGRTPFPDPAEITFAPSASKIVLGPKQQMTSDTPFVWADATASDRTIGASNSFESTACTTRPTRRSLRRLHTFSSPRQRSHTRTNSGGRIGLIAARFGIQSCGCGMLPMTGMRPTSTSERATGSPVSSPTEHDPNARPAAATQSTTTSRLPKKAGSCPKTRGRGLLTGQSPIAGLCPQSPGCP